MKKILSLLLCTLLLLVGCHKAPQVAAEPEIPKNISLSSSRDTYLIDATLEQHNLTATQKVHYVNKEQVELTEVYFHLYPNAYAKEDVVPKSQFDHYYPNGFQPGGITLSQVTIEQKEVPVEYQQDNQIVRIPLAKPLKPGENVLITFAYITSIPNNKDRFGYYGNYYNLTSFYPIACVYDENGFHTPKYCPTGDPFYSDIADYHVNLTLPAEYVVACTGNAQEQIDGDRKKITAYAQNVRDFAVAACPELKLHQESVDGTLVKAYVLDDADGQDALAFSKDSLRYFNQAYGKYPYEQLSVVESPFITGGMEYPNLVLMASSLYDASRKEKTQFNAYYLELVIAHEIAHQWWYGVVGNDQYNEAFLDEALTDYSAMAYMLDKYQKNQRIATAINDYHTAMPYESYHDRAKGQENMAKPLDQFTLPEYTAIVYSKGNLMHQEIERIMGKQAYQDCLKEYYETYRFDTVNTDDFFQHMKQSYAYDWDTFFQKWVYGQ